MAESVYKVIELVGTSPTSWEKAAQAAVKLAAQSLRDMRVAEVGKLDMHLEDGKVIAYRARVKVSFKYGSGPATSPDKETPAAAKAPAKKAKRKKKARRKKA
jgi:flavin-binding protein dodecin